MFTPQNVIINYLEEGVQCDLVARQPFPRILFQKGDQYVS